MRTFAQDANCRACCGMAGSQGIFIKDLKMQLERDLADSLTKTIKLAQLGKYLKHFKSVFRYDSKWQVYAIDGAADSAEGPQNTAEGG